MVSKVLRTKMRALNPVAEEEAVEVVEVIDLALKDHKLNVVAVKATNLLSTTMTSQLYE